MFMFSISIVGQKKGSSSTIPLLNVLPDTTWELFARRDQNCGARTLLQTDDADRKHEHRTRVLPGWLRRRVHNLLRTEASGRGDGVRSRDEDDIPEKPFDRKSR